MQRRKPAAGRTRRRADDGRPSSARDVAIIGAAVRIPGAASPDALVDQLRAGTGVAREMPESRIQLLRAAGLAPPHRARHGGFLDDVVSFDPEFFGLNPQECLTVEPQHRLWLDLAWEATERAGYRPDQLPDRRVGVFAGIASNDFTQWSTRGVLPVDANRIPGGLQSFAAARVAYCMNLNGPAAVVDTACTSSLYAVHIAVQSLRAGETTMCIAGGVNVLLFAETTDLLDAAGLLSHDGSCRSYDDAANGYFRSEGGVALLLKPLDAAVRDGDHVIAIIKGSAAVQDGRERAGFVVPGVAGQRRVAEAALADAGVSPAEVDLIEAQGSPSRLGAGIEIRALTQAYRGARAGRCALGSVKTRVGHLEAASGGVSLLAAALMLERGCLLPNGAVDAPDRHLDLEATPFFLADRARPLTAVKRPWRAGVHAFGMGGLNVHVVLEQAPPGRVPAPTEDRPELFVLSAATPEALRDEAAALAAALERQPCGQLADWCRAAVATRKVRQTRVAFVAASLADLRARLVLVSQEHRDGVAAAGIALSTREERRDFAAQLSALTSGQRALIEVASRGRWAERELHPHLHPARPRRLTAVERAAALEVLGEAFVAGAEIDGAALFARSGASPLPPARRRPRRLWPQSQPLEGVTSVDAPSGFTPRPTQPDRMTADPAPDHPARSDNGDALEALVWRAVDRASQRPIGARDREQSLFDLGLDSVALVRLTVLLEAAIGRPIPPTAALEHPSVAALSAWLAAEGTDSETLRAQLSTAAAAIPPTRRRFALTPLQQAYYAAYHSPGALGGRSCQVFGELEVRGRLDAPRLAAALDVVLRRHPMLTASFDDERTQRLAPADAALPTPLRVETVSHLDAGAAAAVLAALRAELLGGGVDLTAGCLLRAVAVDRGDHFRLLFTVDLIVADLESVRILVGEWRSVYEAPDRPLAPLRLGFDQYLELAERQISPERRQQDREFWTARFDNLPGPPSLPFRTDPAALDDTHFGSLSTEIPPAVWSRLAARARLERVTPSALLAAAFGDVLAEAGDGRPFCLNLPIFDRRPVHPDVDGVVGPFSSNVLLPLSGTTTDVVARAHAIEDELRSALAHRTFTGVMVARSLAARRRSAAPVAPVVFTAPLYGSRFESWGTMIDVRSQTPHVWLDCQAVETVAGLLLRWDYVEELFDPEFVRALFRDFVGLVRTLAEAPNPSIDGPAVRLRYQLAARAAVTAPTLDGLVTAQARRAPHAHALSCQGEAMTYGELDAGADRVATALASAGVAPGDRVVIACERSLAQVAMVVGVLRAGAVYVPVDPRQPDSRASQIVAQSNARTALVDRATFDRPFLAGLSRVTTDDALAAPGAPLPPRRADDLAYVIFTSGSTGLPKGVMITHAAALNTIHDVNARFAIGPLDRILAFSSLGFDLSVWDLFGAFAAGATAVVLPEPALKDPGAWLDLVDQAGITVWDSVPTGMSMLVEYIEGRSRPAGSTLRLVMLSGDWIPVGLPDRVRALFAGAEVVSLGGATEGSIWSCLYRIGEVNPSWTSIPYGRALSRQRFHVLDEHLAPVPEGELGELFIGGRGVALGYLGDETRTRERFVEGPRGLGRLYRTGDLGRWRPDGEMEFHGRRDLQVKIRGFRVEIAEIETALLTHPALADCAVGIRGERTERELVAHYVARGELQTRDLLEHLRARLPDYMVPQHFVRHVALPLNANGKIDRLQLS